MGICCWNFCCFSSDGSKKNKFLSASAEKSMKLILQKLQPQFLSLTCDQTCTYQTNVSTSAIAPSAPHNEPIVYSCLLKKNGDLIVQSDVEDHFLSEEWVALISSLKRAATQFAATLNQTDCPVIHIKGDQHIFACYDVEDSMFAFYTQLPSSEIDKIDCIELDSRIKPILDEVRQVLVQDVRQK